MTLRAGRMSISTTVCVVKNYWFTLSNRASKEELKKMYFLFHYKENSKYIILQHYKQMDLHLFFFFSKPK